jgi:Skp family chaperone for outer membrane proteins
LNDLQKERQEFAENLNSERKKLNSLKHRVRNGDAKEQEISDLHSQLAELQVKCTPVEIREALLNM